MARAVTIMGSIDITRPVDEVFDFVADQTNEPLRSTTQMSVIDLDGGLTFRLIALPDREEERS